MKKLFFILAAAAGILVSCTKNEVAPAEPQEITYMTAPITKAEFDDSYVFKSWAYYNANGTLWSTSNLVGADWDIQNATISKQTDGTWGETGKTYYWPKGGSLTFFAYSLGKGNVDMAASSGSISCAVNTGIRATAYDAIKNANVDFMVADVMDNETVNDDADEQYTEGVKTLFRHKLSKVIFTVETTDNYAASSPAKTFTLNSIVFKKINSVGTYTQVPTEGWTAQGTPVDNHNYYATNLVFGYDSNRKDVSAQSGAHLMYVPQTFTDDMKVEITYTITSSGVNDVVKVEKKLSEVFGTSWALGTQYTCAIKIGLNEILWDPAVQDWTSVDSGSWNIN